MSSVPLWRSWRWGVVAGATAVLVSMPVLVAVRPTRTPPVVAADLAHLVLGSGSVPYEGYASARGGLQFPAFPRAGDAATLLGDRTALRAWVAGPTRWRVDVLSTTGERDTYRDGTTLWTWISHDQRVQRADDTSPLRLPRANDLLPPELGRRLLAGASDTELTTLAPIRVAGHTAAGLRVTPASPDTMVGTVDLWADPTTGVPLRVEVTARGAAHPAFESTFVDFSLTAPSPATVTFVPLAGIPIDNGNDGLDLVQLATRFQRLALPDTLAGTARSSPSGAAATYGQKFDTVTVVAVTQRNAGNLLGADVPTTVRPWGGSARVLSTPLVSVMAVTTNRATYVIAGAVTLEVLDRFAIAIVDGASP
jgi:hypothetical protein